MIYRITKWLFTIVATILLVACAGPVPKIDLAPKAMASIKTIDVVRPPEPKMYAVVNFGHPGMAFGLVGGIVAAADQNNKQEQLARAYRENGVAVCSELSQRIADRLNEMGFNARVVDAKEVKGVDLEEANGKKTLQYKDINSNSDAILIVMPTKIGFVATGLAGGHNNDYLPTISSIITLLGKDRQNPIYRGYHVTGWQLKAEGWRYTAPTTTFSNFDALISNPKNSSASLMDAAAKIANSIAKDLQQQQGIIKVVSTPTVAAVSPIATPVAATTLVPTAAASATSTPERRLSGDELAQHFSVERDVVASFGPHSKVRIVTKPNGDLTIIRVEGRRVGQTASGSIDIRALGNDPQACLKPPLNQFRGLYGCYRLFQQGTDFVLRPVDGEFTLSYRL